VINFTRRAFFVLFGKNIEPEQMTTPRKSTTEVGDSALMTDMKIHFANNSHDFKKNSLENKIQRIFLFANKQIIPILHGDLML